MRTKSIYLGLNLTPILLGPNLNLTASASKAQQSTMVVQMESIILPQGQGGVEGMD